MPRFLFQKSTLRDQILRRLKLLRDLIRLPAVRRRNGDLRQGMAFLIPQIINILAGIQISDLKCKS